MRSKQAAAVVAALVFAACCAAAGSAQADPAPPPGPKTSIDSDGTYVVGTDIVPGTYQSAGPVGDVACYWKRSNGTEIVANALSKKPQVVQIDPTDTTFKTTSCQPWQLTDCTTGCEPTAPAPQDLLGQLKDLLAPH